MCLSDRVARVEGNILFHGKIAQMIFTCWLVAFLQGRDKLGSRPLFVLVKADA